MVSSLTCQSEREKKLLASLIRESSNVIGECIEIGVYWGGSAEIIAHNKGNKRLYLFDTFDKFPDDVSSNERFLIDLFKYKNENGEAQTFVSSFEWENTEVVKGFFPEIVGNKLDNVMFSFVHIDVDTYNSTANCLRYLWPKVSKGGIVVIHDYVNSSLSVKRAVDEFAGIGDKWVFLSDTSQAIIWK